MKNVVYVPFWHTADTDNITRLLCCNHCGLLTFTVQWICKVWSISSGTSEVWSISSGTSDVWSISTETASVTPLVVGVWSRRFAVRCLWVSCQHGTVDGQKTSNIASAAPVEVRVSLCLVAFRVAIGMLEDKKERVCKFCVKHGKNVAETFEL